MYIGRFVVLGKILGGAWYLGYRVSSRSFPNRVIRTAADRAIVLPTADAPASDNPYISYNCLRRCDDTVVVANGSHVDPIIDKISLGYPLRDALAASMLALDYEHDQYNTPRIAAAVDSAADQGFLAIVADDRLTVRRMVVEPGSAALVATYGLTDPSPIDLPGSSVQELCDAVYSSAYEHPVAALVALLDGQELHMAARNAR